jgi:hypothetical protein
MFNTVWFLCVPSQQVCAEGLKCMRLAARRSMYMHAVARPLTRVMHADWNRRSVQHGRKYAVHGREHRLAAL